MSFFSKVKSSLTDLSQSVTQQVANLNIGGSQQQQQQQQQQQPHLNDHTPQNGHVQNGGAQYVQPARESNAPFVRFPLFRSLILGYSGSLISGT